MQYQANKHTFKPQVGITLIPKPSNLSKKTSNPLIHSFIHSLHYM